MLFRSANLFIIAATALGLALASSFYSNSARASLSSALPLAQFQPGTFQSEELGAQTILDLEIDPSSQVTFEDRGLVAGTSSKYSVQVFDRNTGKKIFSGEAIGQFGNRRIAIPMTTKIIPEHDHSIKLAVKRSGSRLPTPIQFETETHRMAQLNPWPYLSSETIAALSVDRGSVTFLDVTPHDGKVETRYKIKLQKRLLGWLWETNVAELEINRSDILPMGAPAQEPIKLPLNLFKTLATGNLQAEDLSSVQIEVTRISPRLQGVSPIRFEKNVTL